jgi:thiamine pyrophosphate-dependent acetolactate synthase large subunit-like protein
MTDQPPDPIARIERPASLIDEQPRYGSDAIAETLRALDLPYMALNPGASYRGLHDSIVNHLGNTQPQMLLCLHEEHAVAIAHGWAKVTGRPLAVAVHSNVGLMHATMAIFNAWCDRMPIVILGATGPVDAAKRRPWIDWIHTAADQGALIRNYTKWDDQPASPLAAREALLRANWIARTAPHGPVYVNLDAGLQEAPLAEPLPPLDPARYMPKLTAAAAPEDVARAAAMLRGAKQPLILMGRASRDRKAWDARVELAERLGARVATDLKIGAAFPTEHPLHLGVPGSFADADVVAAIRAADVILSLDWVDLGGTLHAACGAAPPGRVIQVSLDHILHNGWSMDHHALPPADLLLPAESEQFVADLLRALADQPAPPPHPIARQELAYTPPTGQIHINDVSRAIQTAAGDQPVSLLHVSLSWNAATWPFREPLDFIGGDGGGGIGAGPGISVGAALALRESGRLPIAVCGDGDFMMGSGAVWSAVHYKIPVLIVVANNQSFYNDEVHQERVARMRNRPVENKWIGQRVAEPGIDMAALARAQGAVGFGPVEKGEELLPVLQQAVAALREGHVVVVDVRIATGYTPAMNAALVGR